MELFEIAKKKKTIITREMRAKSNSIKALTNGDIKASTALIEESIRHFYALNALLELQQAIVDEIIENS